MCSVCHHPGHFTGTCLQYAGKRFGSWTIVRGAGCPRDRPMSSYVVARCDCGVERTIPLGHLKSGASRSCGCSRTFMAETAAADMPETVNVFGSQMTIGELASLSGRKPEYIWTRMSRRGMSAEKAAFGTNVRQGEAREKRDACKGLAAERRAAAELRDWLSRNSALRAHPVWSLVFSAAERACDSGGT